MTNFRKVVVENYIKDNYNNAVIVNCLSESQNVLKEYSVENICKADRDWYPLSCYNKDGKLVFGGKNKIVHTYIEGETGSGKTTRLLIQSVFALSHLKNKPSFLVVDPYGETYENLSEILKSNGYNVKVLNGDNPEMSHTYNPFRLMAKRVLEEKSISNDVLSQIRKISEIIEPLEQTEDPIWSQGACSYINGLILDLFEDLLSGEIKEENINLYNLFQRHFWLRNKIKTDVGRLLEIEHFKKKGQKSLVVQKIIGVTDCAETTRASYFGVIENNIDRFGQKTVFQLSSNDTIELEKMYDEPTAIFVQSGSTTVVDDLVSLLISDIYNNAVRLGRKNVNKRLNRDIHLFADEFANFHFGTGDEFIKMLTTSRKFGIHWHMYLQCDAQLDRKFKCKDIGNIIRSNCTEIFLGSHDYNTLERFAVSCGKKTIESLNSKLKQGDISFETLNLMTADKLLATPEGYIYIKTNKENLLYSYFEAFYNCMEYNINIDIMKIYPKNDFDYEKTLCLPENENSFKKSSNARTIDEWFFDELKKDKFDFESKLKWAKINDKKILICDVSIDDLKKLSIKNDIVIDIEKVNLYSNEDSTSDDDFDDDFFDKLFDDE